MRTSDGSVLDIVCCTVAARHLDPDPRALITPQLQRLAEANIMKNLINQKDSESIDAVQALMIMALWPTVCGYDSHLKDTQSLISTAVSMATHMQLNLASEKAISMRESFQKEDGSPVKKEDIVDQMNRARLVCLLYSTIVLW